MLRHRRIGMWLLFQHLLLGWLCHNGGVNNVALSSKVMSKTHRRTSFVLAFGSQQQQQQRRQTTRRRTPCRLTCFYPSVLSKLTESSSSMRFHLSHSNDNQHNDDADEHEQRQVEQEEEWHPHDPASTTPQLLAAIWFQIAQATSMIKGESMTVIYPNMQEQLQINPTFFHRLMAHFDSCKDVCDHFGITTTLQPYFGSAASGKDKQQARVIQGFTVTSHRDPNKDPDANYNDFQYDPFWNEDEDDAIFKLYENIDERIEEQEKSQQAQHGDSSISSSSSSSTNTRAQLRDPFPEIVNKIPDDDEEIFKITKVWVNKLMSDLGICPFTNGPDRAGLPMGQVHYCIDRSTTMEDVYARYWKEVVRVEQQPERDLSTTLLILPEFCIDNLDLFESFLNTLTQPLAALKVEDLIQLVFFHPSYVFRDGAQRSGAATTAAANYARRSPWPMINLLRTTQVRTAQRGIPTGLVYQQNEKTLSSIGSDALETMLRLRDWDDIRDIKVNRRDMEALRVAQDFSNTGQVQAKDLNLQDDSTPAVNKVAKEQVEQGNLVNVMLQALEKRLGKTQILGTASAPSVVVALTGPETSATIMASDFVLSELDRIIATKVSETPPASSSFKNDFQQQQVLLDGSAAAASTTTTAAAATTILTPRMRREEEARKMLMEDLYGVEHSATTSSSGDTGSDNRIGGDMEWRVLMGQSGLVQDWDGDDDSGDRPYSAGMNPDLFY